MQIEFHRCSCVLRSKFGGSWAVCFWVFRIKCLWWNYIALARCVCVEEKKKSNNISSSVIVYRGTNRMRSHACTRPRSKDQTKQLSAIKTIHDGLHDTLHDMQRCEHDVQCSVRIYDEVEFTLNDVNWLVGCGFGTQLACHLHRISHRPRVAMWTWKFIAAKLRKYPFRPHMFGRYEWFRLEVA